MDDKLLFQVFLKFKLPYRNLDKLSGNDPKKSKGFISCNLIDKKNIKSAGGKLYLHSLTQVNKFISELNQNSTINIDDWIKNKFIQTITQYHQWIFQEKINDDCLECEELDDKSSLNNLPYDVLLKSIQALPSDCRVVFCMSIVDGFSISEICERLEISEQRAEYCLKKGRKLI